MPDDYLDICPIGKSQGRFHAAEPVNASSTASRRPHVRAYLEYMYPGLANTFDRRWKVASETICRSYHFKRVKKVQAPVFDFLVDHEVWETFFDEIKSKTSGESQFDMPQWPFKMTSEMMQDSQPSSHEYTEYLEGFTRRKRKQAKRESLLSDISPKAARFNAYSSSVPQIPLAALNPAPGSSSNDAVAPASQPPSTVSHGINTEKLSTAMPPDLSQYQQRLWLWKLAGGNSLFFTRPIIGPFRMKVPPHVSFDTRITGPDLLDCAEIKSSLLPRSCHLKVEIIMVDSNDERPAVVLTLGFNKGYGEKVYDRVELLRFWSGMTDWLYRVYDGVSLSLYRHLHDSLLSRNGNVGGVSEGVSLLYAKHTEVCGYEDQFNMEGLSEED
ncbi:hypothetical protein FNAPI_6775 [Fusarium napiforme]|uniref:Uncharacterized protein n=1 Tax=Fusarium napiforme TaxID=42672 RepID=A0A8H5JHS6_9HYPO|nr:hypothetical protein FNAPI_6775 [Fusarium napiforme]